MRVFTCILLAATSAALLVHFALIWIYGSIVITDPSKIILALETALLLAILAFGIYRFIKEVKDETIISRRSLPTGS